jgi:hypothetical protein
MTSALSLSAAARKEAVRRACSARYGACWWILPERDHEQVLRAIFGGMPELVHHVTSGRGESTAWLHADDFVQLLVCAPRMTGFDEGASA